MEHMRRTFIFAAVSSVAAALLFTAVSDRAAACAASSRRSPAATAASGRPAAGAANDHPHVNLVDVLFTVLDRRNKLVPDLEKERLQDFRRQNSSVHSLLQPPDRSPAAHRPAAGHFQQHSRSPQVRAGRRHVIPFQRHSPQQGSGLRHDLRRRASVCRVSPMTPAACATKSSRPAPAAAPRYSTPSTPPATRNSAIRRGRPAISPTWCAAS